ncbi:MAG: iron-sulfur cluster assembly accessory protein [Bacteroidia bacterium]|nr:iron-sulfur cluster assembly accessory protein [Bacteroidia bacterium]
MESPPFSFTKAAVSELLRLTKTLNIADSQGVRVGVKGGGCSGASLIIGFDEINENDQLFDLSPFRIIIQKGQSMYVAGMLIDFEEGLGFSFNSEPL